MTKTNKQTEVKSKVYKMEDYLSKSAMIRSLSAEGKTRSEIVKIISEAQGFAIRYQHVRQVLITPLVRDLKNGV